MKKRTIIGLIAIVAIAAVVIFAGCIEEAPTAKASATPTRVNIGESVSFSGVDSTDPDGTITSYKWDFDDGTTTSSATVAHSYSIPGTYNVKLTVIDNDGLSDTVQLPVEVVLGSVQIKVTSSTWIEGKEPYDIYSATKEKLEEAGFEVVSNESSVYDALLLVDYKEEEGGSYIGGGYGTDIKCVLKLYDKINNLLFEKEISAGTSAVVSYWEGEDPKEKLYQRAVSNFEDEVYFKKLGEIIASKCGIGDEISVLITALKVEGGYVWGNADTRCSAAKALGEIGDARAVEPLIVTLNDEVPSVRSSAAEALGEIGDERAVESLTATLEDEDGDVRCAAHEALEKIKQADASRTSHTPPTFISRYTPTVIPRYTLSEAITEGLVKAEITGTEASSGDSITLKLTRLTPHTTEIRVPKGTVLLASGIAQNMVVYKVSGIPKGTMRITPVTKIVLDSSEPQTFILEAYCLDFHKENPSSSTKFSVGTLTNSQILRILDASDNLSLDITSVGAIQTAIWVVTEDISKKELVDRFSVEQKDIDNAKVVLEEAGIDTTSKRLFR